MPVFGSDTPVGAGMLWYTDTAPAGYLICDGSAISRSDYAKLFAVVGTSYGVGNGSTTFNLPDLRQRFPIGKAASGTGNSLGATGGAIDHKHTSAAHTHSVPAHYHGMGTGADLAVLDPLSGWSAWGGSVTSVAVRGDTQDAAYAAHTISGRIGLVTGGVDGNAAMTSGSTTPTDTGTNNPPFLVVNYIIKYV